MSSRKYLIPKKTTSTSPQNRVLCRPVANLPRGHARDIYDPGRDTRLCLTNSHQENHNG